MKVYLKYSKLRLAMFCISVLWILYLINFVIDISHTEDNLSIRYQDLSPRDEKSTQDKTMFWRRVAATFTKESSGESRASSDDVIYALRHFHITSASVMKTTDTSLGRHLNQTADLGSTHKWLLILEGGQLVVFKPGWETRDAGYWFENFENPLHEVMSYQMDRLLGFQRTPYTVGRAIHVEREILPVASPALLQYLNQKGSEFCLRDKCYFCKHHLQVCSKAGSIKGAVMYYVNNVSLPLNYPWDINHYHRYRKYGFSNETACTQARRGTVFESSLHFSHLMDLNILDLLTSHFDSKYYFTTTKGSTGAESAVYIDRGRAFSSDEYHTRKDPPVNVIGLWQCCQISSSTFGRLKHLNLEKVSSVMLVALRTDVLYTRWNSQKVTKALSRIQGRFDYLQGLLEKCYEENKDHMFLSH